MTKANKGDKGKTNPTPNPADALDTAGEVVEHLLDDDTISLWEQLQSITADGRIMPEEIPLMVDLLGDVLAEASKLLTFAPNVDPRVKLILGVVAGACQQVGSSLAQEQEKIVSAWTELDDVFADGHVSLGEVTKLVDGVGRMTEAGIAVCVPFVRPEFTDHLQSIVATLLKLVHLMPSSNRPAPRAPAAPALKTNASKPKAIKPVYVKPPKRG